TVTEFERIVIEAVRSGGEILGPTVAGWRTAPVTPPLRKMFRSGKIKPFPGLFYNPLAIKGAAGYVKHLPLFRDGLQDFIRSRPLHEDLKTMKPTTTANDSRKINDVQGACLVMAGAGMCNGGRILHHLKANLWKPGTHVLIVGYQGYSSLGRRLIEGAKE